MNLAEQLCRPELLELTPYVSARRTLSAEINASTGNNIWLNANESPWCNADIPDVNRYPDCQPQALRNAYASYAGVHSKQSLITRGADEGIELLIRTFCVPGKNKIVSLTPSYGMYEISALTCGVEFEAVPWDKEYQLPDTLVEHSQNAKILFICNPNNPTGTIVPVRQIQSVINALPNTLVVVDEAYIEFCPEQSLVNRLNDNPNLIILRTLSKAFALAGARCGFVLASSDIIAMMEKVIAPHPVPVPVSKLALEVLTSSGVELMQSQVRELNSRRQTLVTELDTMPGVQQILTSYSNFVLFRYEDADLLYQTLQQQGIFIRAYPILPGWLRISIGSKFEISVLISALQEFQQDAR